MSTTGSATRDPRFEPNYGIAESAQILRMPTATLSTWVNGRNMPGEGNRAEPLIHRDARDTPLLSFANLVEAHALRALRTRHLVKMGAVRKALRYAEESFHIERLLLRKDLETAAGSLFIERFGDLVNLSHEGQLGLRDVLDLHLRRVGYDEDGLAGRYYPITQGADLNSPRVVVLDPRISFGKAITEHRGVSTDALAGRFEAGDSVLSIARDYGLKVVEVEESIRYETSSRVA